MRVVFWEAIFEISVREFGKTRENKEKKEREVNRAGCGFSFPFLGWEKSWRIEVKIDNSRGSRGVFEFLIIWFRELYLFFIYFFFQVLTSLISFMLCCKNQDTNLCFHYPRSFWSNHFRTCNCISFIFWGFVLNLVMLRVLEWIFMVSALSTSNHFLRNLKPSILDISIYIGLDLIIEGILIIFCLINSRSVAWETLNDPLFFCSCIFWSDHFRIWNCILFIYCVFIFSFDSLENFRTNIFVVSELVASVSGVSWIIIPRYLYVCIILDLIAGEVLILFCLIKLWSVALKNSWLIFAI